MPVERKGKRYFRTRETCREAGISRATLFRWMNEGLIADAGLRDPNGWRLFTEEEIAAIRRKVKAHGTNAPEGSTTRREKRRTSDQR